MNDKLRPEQERDIARDIDKVLRLPDEAIPASLEPQAIVRMLENEKAAAAPAAVTPAAAKRRGWRWAASLGSLAACAAVLFLVLLNGRVFFHDLPYAESTSIGGGENEPAGAPVSDPDDASMDAQETQPLFDNAPDSFGGGVPADQEGDGDGQDASAPTRVEPNAGNAGMNATAATGAGMAATHTGMVAGGATQKTSAKGGTTTSAKANANTTNAPGANANGATKQTTKANGATKQTTKASTATRPPYDADAWKEVSENGAVLLDLRTPEEYGQEHLDGAINLPFAELEEGIQRYPKDTNLVLFSGSYDVSARAAARLSGIGYTQVRILDLAYAE